MKLDPSTMEVAGIFKPAEVERPVTPRSAASNTSSVEGGIFAPNMAPPPQVLAPLRATAVEAVDAAEGGGFLVRAA